MAVDKLVDSAQLDSDLTSVANAIRTKGGTSAQLAFPAGFVSAIGDIPTGGQSNWTLIGTKTLTLQEYTGTTAEETATGFTQEDMGDYAFLLAVITCDSAITGSGEWGMTMQSIGRASTGRTVSNAAIEQIGTATLSFAAQTGSAYSGIAYGVWIGANKQDIVLERKCDTTHITKTRGGKYTVKLYGLSSL